MSMVMTSKELVRYINENPDKEYVVKLIQNETNDITVNKGRSKRRVIIYESKSKSKSDI